MQPVTYRLTPLAIALVAFGATGAGAATVAPVHVGPLVHITGKIGRAAAGKILSTSDGGQIFGFDIDQNGADGALASWTSSQMSVQTFSQKTAKITRTLAVKRGKDPQKGDDYVFDGIFAGDVGLVDLQKAGIPGQTPTHDMYKTLSPVTGMKLNGKWNPTISLFNVLSYAPNQSTPVNVLYGYQREGSDLPVLIVANVAADTVSNVIQLNAAQFFIPTSPQFAQDTINNQAVFATSPSEGAAGGPPPVIGTIDLASGNVKEFNGATCPGSVGCGYANGIGYDPNTGIACTTTELDGGVEFYTMSQEFGKHVYMPNGGGQSFAGSYVAADTVHQLFLIAQTFSSTSQSGSSIQVYDESGNFVESVNGLNFTDAGFEVIPTHIAINPTTRTGWVPGPGANQIQQFTY